VSALCANNPAIAEKRPMLSDGAVKVMENENIGVTCQAT